MQHMYRGTWVPSMSMAQSEDGLPPQRCCLCLMIMLMSYMHRMLRSLLPPCLQLPISPLEVPPLHRHRHMHTRWPCHPCLSKNQHATVQALVQDDGIMMGSDSEGADSDRHTDSVMEMNDHSDDSMAAPDDSVRLPPTHCRCSPSPICCCRPASCQACAWLQCAGKTLPPVCLLHYLLHACSHRNSSNISAD